MLLTYYCPIFYFIQDCTFSPKFQDHVDNLNDLHRHLNVLYGYAENYGKNKTDSSADILREGFECLRDYCKDNNVSLVELFEKFDTDSSMSVSLQEFQDGLKVRARQTRLHYTLSVRFYPYQILNLYT